VRLAELWSSLAGSGGVFSGSVVTRAATAVRSGTHLHGRGPLRALLEEHLPVQRIEDLAVPFQCVAASIERAAEHWFSDGPAVRRGDGLVRGARGCWRRCASATSTSSTAGS
jgi:NTE family protein